MIFFCLRASRGKKTCDFFDFFLFFLNGEKNEIRFAQQIIFSYSFDEILDIFASLFFKDEKKEDTKKTPPNLVLLKTIKKKRDGYTSVSS
jgi:hypothetical protein